MVCQDARLVLEIKQGESRGFGFTIEQDNQPMNLTGFTVLFEVKRSPYFVLPAIITKTITETSSDIDTGRISYPLEGKFKVIITEDETIKYNPADYFLIITLIDQDTKIIISGEGDTSGIFRICKQ